MMTTIAQRSQYSPSLMRRLNAMAGYDRTRVKFAELGGDGADAPFEQAFSNLAHAYLSDKAPSLLDHELGFQLLDRNQKNTKAIGVFGFKVGSSRLFAPVFFLQGDLKGHELLYLKNQDMFVPLKENWLNYILNRKPNILGDRVTRQTARLGVLQPDLNRLSRSPYKYASALPEEFRDVMPALAHAAQPTAEAGLRKAAEEIKALGETFNLPKFLKQASLSTLNWLVKQCEARPALAKAIEEFHGLDCISDGIKTAKARGGSSIMDGPAQAPATRALYSGSVLDAARPEHPIKTGALEVINYDYTVNTKTPEGLSEEDAEKLLKDGILIKDHRTGEEVSVPYNVDVEQKLFNPTETGIYQVLVKPGDFERCFIAYQPQGPNGRQNFVTVVRLDGERNWLNTHATRIWCASREEDKNTTRDWIDELPTTETVSTSDSSRFMILTTRGGATVPLRIEKSLGDARGGQSYECDPADDANHRYASPVNQPDRDYHPWGVGGSDLDKYDKWQDGCRLHMDSKNGTQLRSKNGDIWAPTDAKVLRVEPSRKDEDDKDRENDKFVSMSINDGDSSGSSKNLPIRPGDMVDAEMAIMTKTSELKIYHDGTEVQIGKERMAPKAAFVHLIRDHGFREDISRQLLKTAFKKRAYTFRVKYAQPPYLTNEGPDAPGITDQQRGGENYMGFPGETVEPYTEEQIVPGMSAANTDPDVYNPSPSAVGEPMDNQMVEQAAQSGQKEVFDTAMIGSMLKAVRDDTMIDRYLPDLIKGMDRLGRILFMFYWHGDKFADRYGKADMPELEDSLRNAFEMMGDVVLFLRQKTIEPYPEEDAASLDLGDSASI